MVGLPCKVGQETYFWIGELSGFLGFFCCCFNFGSPHIPTKSCLSTIKGAIKRMVQCQQQVAKGGGKTCKLSLLLGKRFVKLHPE